MRGDRHGGLGARDRRRTKRHPAGADPRLPGDHDSPSDFAGYDLGPSSPELQRSVLGGGLNHSWLIQAALLGVPLESLDVEVTGQLDARAGRPGFEAVPVLPHEHDVEEALILAERVIVVGPRPATITAEIMNDLPYPRHRDRPKIVALRQEVVGLLGLA